MDVPARRIVKSLSERRAPLAWPAKDADEVLDYALDWSDRIGSDTITSSTHSLTTEAGLVIDEQSHEDEFSIVTLSGGTVGSKGKILCRIVTDRGLTLDETVSLLVRAR